jgi:signal transduction histidine kinase
MRGRLTAAGVSNATDARVHAARAKASLASVLPEIALAVFCLFNMAWVAIWHGMEAFPVHFIYISVSIVYGLRMWRKRTIAFVLVAVSVPTFLLIARAVVNGEESRAELSEIPLMSVLLVVIVWHVCRRQRAVEHERAFFGNASHELLTPLTIARGELELLARDGAAPTIEEVRATQRVVLEELQRSEVLAAGLLTLARLDGPFRGQRSVVSSDDLIDASVERWNRVTNPPVVIAERAGGSVACVRQDIARLLDNLISNALHHSPDGSTVTVAARARGHRLVLEIADQGRGIPGDELPYIFDRFYRARSADGTRGSGLGLAIVKAIAEAHGGSVDVESTVGSGTTFRVELAGFERETAERRVPLLA